MRLVGHDGKYPFVRINVKPARNELTHVNSVAARLEYLAVKLKLKRRGRSSAITTIPNRYPENMLMRMKRPS